MDTKALRRKRIHLGIRKKIRGTSNKPRLSVFRSNKVIYVQAVDDIGNHTICAASSKGISGNKSEVAKQTGKQIAEKLLAMDIQTIVFDRSGYLYHGRVKSLADGAREAGLKF
jgi:large subunit ribosomal protein L18